MQTTMMLEQDSVNVDLADIMEVVTMYKCKFCNFSCDQPSGIGQHVQRTHTIVKHSKLQSSHQVLQMVSTTESSEEHTMEAAEPVSVTFEAGTQSNQGKAVLETEDVTTNSLGGVMLDADEMEENQAEMEVADRIIDSAGTHHDDGMDADECANGIAVNKEIYLCGQCNLGFDSMENCKNHMIRDHNIVIDEDVEPEGKTPLEICPEVCDTSTDVHIPGEVIFPPNRVSVGTQVMTRKKPGRKRKIKTEAKPQMSIEEEFEEEMAAAEMAAERDSQSEMHYEDGESRLAIGKEPPEEYAEEGTGLGRRRRRLPTRLASLYYMGKRSPIRPPSVRHPSPTKIKVEPYKLRCPKSGCHTKFRTEPSLNLHLACHKRIETETGKRELFACPKCEITEAQWKVLRVHLWKDHMIDTDLFACDKCDFKVDTLFRLERHAQIHSEARPYVCPTCKKGFKQASQLHNHKAMHLDRSTDSSKWYSTRLCDICKRTFANQKSLKIHIETVHNKERRFVCPYCNHTTSRKAILDLHVRTHTGEKPFKCDMCAYMTGDHNSLRRHKMRHTGEKPYRCRYCPYSAIQAISLKTHMKNKHPGYEGIFACNLCQYQTVNELYYNQHLLDHKNGLVQSIRTTVVMRPRVGAGAEDTPELVVGATGHQPLGKSIVAPGQTMLRPAPAVTHQRLITLPDGRQAVAIQAPSLNAGSSSQLPVSLTKLSDLGVLEVGSDMANLIYTALSALSQTSAMPEDTGATQALPGGLHAQPTVQSTTHEGVTTHTITFHIPPSEEANETGIKQSSIPAPTTTSNTDSPDHVQQEDTTTEVIQVEQEDSQVLLTMQPAGNQQQQATIDEVIGDDAVEVTFATEDMGDSRGGVRVLEIMPAETVDAHADVLAEVSRVEGQKETVTEQAESLEITPVTEVMGGENGDVNTIVMEVVDEGGNIQQTQYVTCTIDPAT